MRASEQLATLPAEPHPWVRRAAAAALGASTLAMYAATAAPCAWWGDGMELACAAWTLGIAHPPGAPFYTLLGWGWMHGWAPWMDPGRALTLLSATELAAATIILTLWFRRWIAALAGLWSGAPGCACGMADLLPAAGVALLLAFARTPWEHATFAEVYPTAYVLAVATLAAAWPAPDRPLTVRRASALGLLTALGMLSHYAFAAAAFPAGAALATAPRGRRGRAAAALAATLALALALGWGWMGWRAASNPPLNWGDPSHPARWWRHLTGGQFRDLNAGFDAVRSAAGLANWLRWWGMQALPAAWAAGPVAAAAGAVTLGLAAAGLIGLARRLPALGLGLLGMLAAGGFFGAAYHIPDIDGFFMMTLPAAGMGWIAAAGMIVSRLRRRRPTLARGAFGRAVPAVGALALVAIHYPAVDKSWDDGPLAWSAGLMATAPPDAIVLTGGDSDIFPLWYRQMVLGERPDVAVVGAQFIFQGWYRRYFERPDRPSIALHAEDRAPGAKRDFDRALIRWVLWPNLASGRRIVMTYYDALLYALFSPRALSPPLLPADYARRCAYRFGLPAPVPAELQWAAARERLGEQGLDALDAWIDRFYATPGRAR